jgi:hypothetical protein
MAEVLKDYSSIFFPSLPGFLDLEKSFEIWRRHLGRAIAASADPDIFSPFQAW